MTEVTYPNGVVLAWDETLHVGDLVTAYEDGYHVIAGFTFRDGMVPLVHYVRVVSSSGRITKSKMLSCDASFVRRFTREDVTNLFRAETNAATIKRNNLMEYVTR